MSKELAPKAVPGEHSKNRERRVFGWQEQLKVGQAGEALFSEHYHNGPLETIVEHYADFKTPEGKILELKTDTYPIEKTPNFYFERYSDGAKKTPGSVWQSYPKGVEILCYFFMSSGVYFEFTDIPLLIENLEDYIRDKSYVQVRNRGYTSIGYKVPRELLNHLWRKYTIEPELDILVQET